MAEQRVTVECGECGAKYAGILDMTRPFECYECGTTLYRPAQRAPAGLLVAGYFIVLFGLLLALGTLVHYAR